MFLMKTDYARPELLISCIKTNPFLSLLISNIKWVFHPSLAKPAIFTSKRLLISEVPSEARWVGRCKQVSRQVPEITQPRTTWFNLVAQSKGISKTTSTELWLIWIWLSQEPYLPRRKTQNSRHTCHPFYILQYSSSPWNFSVYTARWCALSFF